MDPLASQDPKCPECKWQPLQFNTSVMTLETGAVVACIWCIHCGHVLNTQCLGIQQPQIARPQLIINRN